MIRLHKKDEKDEKSEIPQNSNSQIYTYKCKHDTKYSSITGNPFKYMTEQSPTNLLYIFNGEVTDNL